MNVSDPDPPSTNELLTRFLALVAPGMEEGPRAYRGRVYREVEGLGWRRDWSESDPIGAVLDHVLQGAGAGPCELWEDPDGETGRLGAMGVTVPSSERVAFVCIDLDGGYSCADVVEAWSERFGPRSFVLTPGSGRPGRFRLWFRLQPTALYRLRPKVEQIMNELGYPLKQGAAELYPDPKRPGRLPLGPGGCVRYLGARFEPRALHPWRLLAAFERLKVLDFSSYTGALPASVLRRRRRALVPSPDAKRVKGEGCLPHAFRALWREGAHPGGRRWWIREMTVAWHRVGKTRRECQRILQATAGAKLWRTKGWRGPAERAATRDDIKATVDAYYNQYKQALPSPENLTASELRRLVAHCESRAGIYCHNGRAYAVTPTALIAFGIRALEQARGCFLRGFHPTTDRRIDARRVKYRYHRSSWERCARGTGVPYYVLRRALALFEDSGESYLPTHLAWRPGEARCKSWLCSFRFGSERSPRRSLVGSSSRARAGYTARVWASRERSLGRSGGPVEHSRLPKGEARSFAGGLSPGASDGDDYQSSGPSRTRRRKPPADAEGVARPPAIPPANDRASPFGSLECSTGPPDRPSDREKIGLC